jgi:flagellar biosynthesis protein FliQ
VTTFMFALAVVAGLIGFLFLTDATRGVGFVALACLFGILARILQADQIRDDTLSFLQKRLPKREQEPDAQRR